MQDSLKFIHGAIAKTDTIPAFTHFVIDGCEIRACNGVIAMGCPIKFNISCVPKADTFEKALQNSAETCTLTLTPAGKLSVVNGKLKALINCLSNESTPHFTPAGIKVEFNAQQLIKACRVLFKFIGTDETRIWSNGILLKDGSAFATNNVMLVEHWLGFNLPEPITIPTAFVKEILRIDELPIQMFYSSESNSLTLIYENDKWIRTQLLSANWPDLTAVLNVSSNTKPLNGKIFEGVKTLKPFADKMNRVYLKPSELATHSDESEGAKWELEAPLDVTVACFNIDMFMLLEGTADTIDFTTYPKPCQFFGNELRGAMVGITL